MMHLLRVAVLSSWLLAEPASAASPDAQAVADAEEAHATGELVVAAALYEQMWTTSGEPEWLARAGRCRLEAGQRAHAAAYLEQALASPGRMDDRTGAMQALERALQATAVVYVEVEGDADSADMVVIAERAEGEATLPRLEIRAAITPNSAGAQIVPIRLDLGRWTLRVIVGIRERAVETLVLRSLAPQRLVIAGPKPAEIRKPSRAWIAAPAVVGGVSLIAGAALVGTSQPEFAETLATEVCSTSNETIDACSALAKRSTYRLGGGALLLGASVGVLAGGLTGLVPDKARRRKAWIAEAGSGGALVAVSVGLVMSGALNFTSANSNAASWSGGSLELVEAGARLYAIGTGILGAGAGLAVAAAGGLIAEAAQRRSRRYTRRDRWQLAGMGVRF